MCCMIAQDIRLARFPPPVACVLCAGPPHNAMYHAISHRASLHNHKARAAARVVAAGLLPLAAASR